MEKIFSTSLAWALTKRPNASLSSWSWTHSLPSCLSDPLLDLGTWVGSYARDWGTDRVPWMIKTEVNSQELEQYLDIHLYWLNISTDALILIALAKSGINYKNRVKWI